jgi:hypothetical protein
MNDYTAPDPIVHPPGCDKAAALRAKYQVPVGGHRQGQPPRRNPGDTVANLSVAARVRLAELNADYDRRARHAWELIQAGTPREEALKAAQISITAARPRWARMGLK